MTSSISQVYIGTMGQTGPTGPTHNSGSIHIYSDSSIAITPYSTNYIQLGDNQIIQSMTGGSPGDIINIKSDVFPPPDIPGKTYLTLQNGVGSNSLLLRDSKDVSLYIDDSVMFQNDGTQWIEISRNIQKVLSHQSSSSSKTINHNTEATASLALTHDQFEFDGSTAIEIMYFMPKLDLADTSFSVILFDNGSSVGKMGYSNITATYPSSVSRLLTPTSGSHEYSIRLLNSGSNPTTISAGAGTSSGSNPGPMYSIMRRIS